MSPAGIAQRNQQNAQHSTGPKTEQGKAISSQNARKHGLSGKLIHKSQAEIDRYQKRIAELTRYYRLSNPVAAPVIEALVTAEFRRSQAFAAEQDVLVQLKLNVIDGLDEDSQEISDEELDGLARLKDAETTKLLPQLNRHYVAADRSWHKHFKLLQELRAAEEAEVRDLEQLNAVRSRLQRDFAAVAQNEARSTSQPAETRQAGTITNVVQS